MKGCGASGKSCRATARSPPCGISAAPWRIMAVALALLALLIELMVGYPDRLLRAIGHPVTWIGRLIGAQDARLNRDSATPAARRMAGTIAVLILVAGVG